MMDVSVYLGFDSRGSKTLYGHIYYKDSKIESSVPAGKSTGVHEVKSYPNDSIDSSISAFYKVKKYLPDIFDNSDSIEEFDSKVSELDSVNSLGGSLTLILSNMFLKYIAQKNNMDVYEYLNEDASLADVPRSLGNIIGGGLHSSKGSMSVQEIHVCSNEGNIFDNVSLNIEIHKRISEILSSKGIFSAKNDEGAISASISFADAMDLVSNTCSELSGSVDIGLDIAASSFYKNGTYNFDGRNYNEDQFLDVVSGIVEDYNLFYVEDPFSEESFDTFAKLQMSFPKVLVCGDDLYTTNTARLLKGIESMSSKAILIKPNQIGNITNTIKAVRLAKENGITPVISHRSGETSDYLISDLAVGLKIPFIKTGIMSGERLSKLNRLIEISNNLK